MTKKYVIQFQFDTGETFTWKYSSIIERAKELKRIKKQFNSGRIKEYKTFCIDEK